MQRVVSVLPVLHYSELRKHIIYMWLPAHIPLCFLLNQEVLSLWCEMLRYLRAGLGTVKLKAAWCQQISDLTTTDSQTILSLFAVLSLESLPSRCLLSFLPFLFWCSLWESRDSVSISTQRINELCCKGQRECSEVSQCMSSKWGQPDAFRLFRTNYWDIK